VTWGYFYRRASLFLPAVFILGIALALFPGYKEERLARGGEDLSNLHGWRLIMPRWWAILAVALAAAAANAVLTASR